LILLGGGAKGFSYAKRVSEHWIVYALQIQNTSQHGRQVHDEIARISNTERRVPWKYESSSIGSSFLLSS
jgi:hypothetical protein